ncbi:MAG: acetolactate synthase small subunit [Planctomycetes bacterium]|nr:acetolactate synthase small subunit [Planctomycetota bacterium]
MRRQVLACRVENHSGVLTHITGLFASRGFNIDSLSVGETDNPRFSRVTIVCRGDERILEQIRKQLGKLIDVIKVINLSEMESVERELMLVRVNVGPSKRAEVMEIAEVFRAKVVDVGAKELMIEISGKRAKVDAFIDLMRPYGIKEMARTGEVALARGPKPSAAGG